MKKQTPSSQSAFFNPRVVIGVCVGGFGLILALLRFGAFSAKAEQNYSVTTRSMDPLVPLFFDCSKIRELGKIGRA